MVFFKQQVFLSWALLQTITNNFGDQYYVQSFSLIISLFWMFFWCVLHHCFCLYCFHHIFCHQVVHLVLGDAGIRTHIRGPWLELNREYSAFTTRLGVNFINDPRATFMPADPECAKKDIQVSSVVWHFWDLRA